MKTRLSKQVKRSMGLKTVNGEIVDKYGRTFETYVDDQGYEDIKPIGVFKNMRDYYVTA